MFYTYLVSYAYQGKTGNNGFGRTVSGTNQKLSSPERVSEMETHILGLNGDASEIAILGIVLLSKRIDIRGIVQQIKGWF